jgi:ornithine cyclodeaminase/alanine dehydrogenase-like protein (mu-crystallin family)
MTLILNNDDVNQVLTMKITMEALEKAYGELAREEQSAARASTSDSHQNAEKLSVGHDGGPDLRLLRHPDEIRRSMSRNIRRDHAGEILRAAGPLCGLILLTSIENGEPLALINDGYLQHMRVGADSASAPSSWRGRREGRWHDRLSGMARSHVESFLLARQIKRFRSTARQKRIAKPTLKRSAKVRPRSRPAQYPGEVYKGAHIVAGCSDSSVPNVYGKWLEEERMSASAASRTRRRESASTFLCGWEVRRIRGPAAFRRRRRVYHLRRQAQ